LIGAPGYTVANTLTGIFRSLLPVGTTRNVQSIKVTLPAPLVLTQGVYWLRFGYTGVNFTPPITVLNQGLTGNALQNTTATGWLPVTSGTTPVYAQGLPFKLYGAPITAGSITNTGLAACGATTITVNGAPVLGGFVRTELGGVTGLGLIGYGFSPVPTPFCGCVVGHDWSVVILANSTVLNIPMATAFCGTRLRVQGADFGGVGGCALGITFTDTYQIALN
jgi:hypothetical protein